MSTKGRRSTKAKQTRDAKDPQAYDHKKGEDKLLLRPDVGLQAQFRQKKPPKSYRYDPGLDPALSWDVSADRERAEALVARIEQAEDLTEAKLAAAELRQMSRPFLNWAGKAERGEFTVPTLPLFVHERLSTQAILQSVKSHKRDRQQTLALFADEELDVADRLLKAYTYQTDWVNRLLLGDSLVVMNSLLQYEGLGGQVQMLYMDPPYGVKFGSNFQPFIRRRDVRHGDDGDLTREPEMVQAYRDTWELGLHSYLTYLRDRLLLARELLNERGSIFVQISDENLHHVREVMDEVFGAENCIAVIAFKKTGFASDETLSTTHDFLLWYAKRSEDIKLRSVFGERELLPNELFFYDQIELPDGTRRPLSSDEKNLGPRIREIGRPYARNPMVSPGWQDSLSLPVEFEGRTFRPPPNRHWATTQEGIERLREARRLAIKGNTLRFIRYFDDFPLQPLGTVWNDTGVGGFVGDERLYVVQTDVRVIQRCLLMTTDPGDLVLDPTCGSGTTAYVAEQWGRRWITIDTSRVPLALARQRLLTATFPYYELRDPARGPGGGFVYKRKHNQKGEEVGGIVPHITLKSIAQNEPPQEEVLVDRPEVESSIVRVSGPFVVEATIPTAIELSPTGATNDNQASYEADPIGRMIEVLRRSPTLRLAGNQSVTLKHIRRPAKAMDLHAEAELVEPTLEDLAEEAATQKSLDMKRGKPVAFIFGPEHGPVTEQMVFAAAKEAHLKSYNRLFVVGFAIQPGASKLIQNCEQAVGLPATYVQATMDLVMNDLLKTTRASQIFSVTGAPDIRLIRLKRKNGNGPLYRVELLGLDVFDPVTMQNDHRKGDDVPAWLLDADYDDLVFHVTQAFFPRTSAWDHLKRALKGTYEDSVWEHLAGTVSEPFAAGEHKKIAVKVIDDRGNELMVVRWLADAESER
ncbi:DNA methylase [Candidatus Methylomirabilis lanthanidiphila]|uniref:DNA methylase n=1 Tax=Candidatus Methylomirabilis lanthanidiphila TaxID=2211376 RepID=A0A564ZKZ3_9BACT|nr:site-specific DNA-methyltransferase [Candidatus Methylomirabilis lanthanidiphila]VUZ85776.1 DNA methylase [Candidatus Methylomirabilis lanthanidiphila]